MVGSLFLQNCNLREIQSNRITAVGLIYCASSKQSMTHGGYHEEKSFTCLVAVFAVVICVALLAN